MKRKLATIRKINNIVPIEGADAIELAKVDGWQVVVKKDEFQVGDLCIYCEIDSVLPEREEFEFLRSKKFRIKTIKLKGQLSQGIIFPLSIIPIEVLANMDGIFDEGLDLTDPLGITKYEPPIPAQLAGTARGNFPGVIPKTDEERCQNLVKEILDYSIQFVPFVVTEKLDGSSSTFAIINDEFHVCSRNLDLKEFDDTLGERTTQSKNTLWRVARELDIENKLRDYCKSKNIKQIAIQGELIGEGIQGNKYKLKGQTVKFFNGFDINRQMYLSHIQLMDLLVTCGLESVPIIYHDYYIDPHLVREDFDSFLKIADGKSVLNPNQRREGLVFKANLTYDSNYGKKSFKIISNEFLLKDEN